MSTWHERLPVLLSLMIALGCVTGACSIETGPGVTGSGDVVTRKVTDLGEFRRVTARASFDVTVTSGESHRVEVRADDNVIDDVVVEVGGETLEIKLGYGVGRLSDVTLEADVVMPALEGLEATGASDIEVAAEFESETFDASASGSSAVTATLGADTGRVEASGDSEITLAGKIGSLDANASGASTLALADLEVRDLDIELTGASEASVDVTGTLSASASGASDLTYTGNPRIDKSDTSGSSKIGPR